MYDNHFDRNYFLNVTLREVERNAWTPRFTGIHGMGTSMSVMGAPSMSGAYYPQPGVMRSLTDTSRVARVRRALIDSEGEALQMLSRKYRDIQIDAVAPRLLSACLDLALQLGSRQVTLSGNATLGVGSMPDLSRFLAAFWGLKPIAPVLAAGIQTKLSDYDLAFKSAWGSRQPQTAQSDRLMELSATRFFAHGHVTAITAMLSGVVAYAKRGPGAPADVLTQLAPQIQKSPHLGASFAQWLQQQQTQIVAHPLLNRRASAGATQDGAIPFTPPARSAVAPTSAVAVAPPEFNPIDTMDQDVQAAAMVRAAANGTPFCAVCEKAAAARAA